MNEEIVSGLSLLVIGMITVFVVLTIIVYMGELLIRIVNLLPEDKKIDQKKNPNIDNKTVSVITTAVLEITKGKGYITKIEKQN